MDRRAWACLTGAIVVLGIAAVPVTFGEYFLRKDVENELSQLREEIERENRALEKIKNDIERVENANLQDVRIVGANGEDVIAAGDNGIVLHSGSGGATWRSRNSRATADLRALAFTPGDNRVIAVGDNGMAIYSKNSGRVWRAGETTTDKSLTAVAVGNNGKNAIAVGRGGTVQYSTNGGETWTQADIEPKPEGSAVGNTLNAVIFAADGSDKAAAVGNDGLIIYSKNGGKAWTEYRQKVTEEDLRAIARYGKGGMVVVGENRAIASSPDGGKTWSLEKQEKRQGKKRLHLYSVAVGVNTDATEADRNTAVAVGRRGLVLVREAGGSWKPPEKMPPGFRDDLNAVAISPDGEMFVAAGEDGAILVSHDGGKNWTYRDGKTRAELNAVAFDGKSAVIVGRNSTILTLDISGNVTLENAPVKIAMNETAVATQTRLLHERLRTIEENIQALKNREQDLIVDESRFGVDSVWQLLFRINSYRIAILLIAFFAAQHLFGMARYNFRLAAFYRARSDAMALAPQSASPWPERTEEFEQFVRTLAPDELDFRRTPRNPSHWDRHTGALMTARAGRNPDAGPSGETSGPAGGPA